MYGHHNNNNICHKIFTSNRHNNHHSQSHKYLSNNSSSLFLIDVIFIVMDCCMYGSASILHRISNKIDTRSGMSCECILRIFILRFCTCCIDDNAKCPEKITVVYCRNHHHDVVKDILHNKSFCIHYISDQELHLFISSLNNFPMDTFFDLDVT